MNWDEDVVEQHYATDRLDVQANIAFSLMAFGLFCGVALWAVLLYIVAMELAR